MSLPHLLSSYWDWAGSNLGAMPAEALVTAIATAVLWKPLRAVSRKLRASLLADVHKRLDEIGGSASAAHRIAAATHLHLTGAAHPDAPVPGEGGERLKGRERR